MDSDENDLYENSSTQNTYVLNLSCRTNVAGALNYISGAREWFPDNALLFTKTIASGAGHVRAIFRLLYEISLLKDSLIPLFDVALRLAYKAVTCNYGLKINILQIYLEEQV